MRQLSKGLRCHDHEEYFLARYASLWQRAYRLTGDPAAADDLTQEAYLRFTLSRPDLSAIENLDAYLLKIVQNIHLGKVRRKGSRYECSLEYFEYDTAELAATHVDPRRWLLARHQLRNVCEYGCQRRLASRVGSAFLLRFFHGMVPTEIARLANVSSRTADDWLRAARQEASEYLAGLSRVIPPTPADFLRRGTKSGGSTPAGESAVTLIEELRASIFAHKHAECFTSEMWNHIYAREDQPIATEHLAEIVTCPVCLDRALARGGMPPLASRSPFDSTRRGQGAPRPTFATVSALRRNLLQRTEHRPGGLLVAVNGFVVGSERLSGGSSVMSVSVNAPESLGFVELLSDQELCLVHLNVDAPPLGDPKQSAIVTMSDGRSAALTVVFDHAWPTVCVSYTDPAGNAPPIAVSNAKSETKAASRPKVSWLNHFGRAWEGLSGTRWVDGSLTSALGFARGMAVLLLLVLVGYAVMQFIQPPVTAEALIRKAVEHEREWGAAPGQVVRRVVQLQERGVGSPVVRSVRRIESWREARRKVTRVYDERNRLLAGEWLHEDGSRTIYRVGSPARTASPDEELALTPDDIWRQGVGAAEFSQIVGTSAALTLERGSTEDVVRLAARSGGVESAALTISSSTHRATGLVVVVRVGAELLEYRFEESYCLQAPLKALPPGAFEPEPALTTPTAIGAARTVRPARVPVPTVDERFPDARLNSLEMQSTLALYRIGVCVTVPARIERSRQSGIRIAVIAAGESCREEASAALTKLAAQPEVTVEIETATSSSPAVQSQPMALSEEDPNLEQLPVYTWLASHFAQASGFQRSEAGVRQAARRQLLWARAQSDELANRGRMLRRLNSRWTPQDLRRMDQEGLAAWQQLVRYQAGSIGSNARLLRLQLAPIFRTNSLAPEVFEEATPALSLSEAHAQIDALCGLVDAAHAASQSWLGGTPIGISDHQLRAVERAASQLGSSWTPFELPLLR